MKTIEMAIKIAFSRIWVESENLRKRNSRLMPHKLTLATIDRCVGALLKVSVMSPTF